MEKEKKWMEREADQPHVRRPLGMTTVVTGDLGGDGPFATWSS